MGKQLIAVISILFILASALPSMAHNRPITPDLVEQLFQECVTTPDTDEALSRYAFSYGQWLLIARYFAENLENPLASFYPGESMIEYRLRHVFLNLVLDIAGELEYNEVLEGTYVRQEYEGNVDSDYYIDFGHGDRQWIKIYYATTLFDPRLTPIGYIAQGTRLRLYLDANNQAIKVMLAPSNQALLPVFTPEYLADSSAHPEPAEEPFDIYQQPRKAIHLGSSKVYLLTSYQFLYTRTYEPAITEEQPPPRWRPEPLIGSAQPHQPYSWHWSPFCFPPKS